ncbi:MAG: aromatic ring-hydroxylating oxygenase subunit alpha [Burkholderiaceae bacterium]
MSNLSEQFNLKPSFHQLSVDMYFDHARHARELDRLFVQGPGYVGHRQWAPDQGDWRSIPWENDGRLLVHNQRGIELLSNVCRHRQAIMLRGHGNQQNIVCPLHRWTYDLDGTLMGAPHFAEAPCSRLEKFPLQDWRGLQFSSRRDISKELSGVPFLAEFDFNGFILDKIQIHECRYNWKTFIEVYLEDYHVDPFHPGLGQFVNCSNLQWFTGVNWSVQSVGLKAGLRRPGTPVYAKWHEAVRHFSNDQDPAYGAIWFCMYPNIMVEWYPHVLVVSTLHPRGPRHTTNYVEFYYPEEIAWFEHEFVEAEQAAYMETAIEDDEIAMRMDEGREALLKRGANEIGPYQSPMEDGMQHFHEWYKQAMQEVR